MYVLAIHVITITTIINLLFYFRDRSHYIKTSLGARKMVQQVEVLAAKPDYPRSLPRTYMEKEIKLSSDPTPKHVT